MAIKMPSGHPIRAWTENPDAVVFCPYENEAGHTALMRSLRLSLQLPKSVGVIELWNHWYTNGSDPDPDTKQYQWADVGSVRLLVNMMHHYGYPVISYVNPSRCRNFGLSGDDLIDIFLQLVESLPGIALDGLYIDGLAPDGREVDEARTLDWYAKFAGKWGERFGGHPLITQHSSARVAPSLAALRYAQRIYFGEHGGPTPPWSWFTFPNWSVNCGADWNHLSSLGDPLWHRYVRTILGGGCLPIYKMASCHRTGTIDGYPTDWPTNEQWLKMAAIHGCHRQWVMHESNLVTMRNIIAARETPKGGK